MATKAPNQEAARQERSLDKVVLRAGSNTITVKGAVVSSFLVTTGQGDSGGPVADVAFAGEITAEVAPSRDDTSGVDE